MRKQKNIKLTDYLNNNSILNNKAFKPQSNDICQIGSVDPWICSQIQSLDLSNNKLRYLKGIQNLNYLKQLDISNNKIQSCRQLQHLFKLQLKKLYINNNPFLDEPIDEHILQFLLNKQTDIQIFSYEILNSIKELQDKEIKIIFLKNYKNKIDIHHQLKKKYQINSGNIYGDMENIMIKIMPQLYDTIQDSNLTKQLKRQAFVTKKQKNQTIECAIDSTRKQKEVLIDQLIKDIVLLLDNHKEFKQSSQAYLLEVNFSDNTISFSPDKRGMRNQVSISMSPAIQLPDKRDMRNQRSIQMSPVIYISPGKNQNSFQEITLMNIKNKQSLPTHIKNSKFTKNTSQNSDKLLSNMKTTIKNTSQHSLPALLQKLKSYNNFKINYLSQLKKIKERQSLSSSLYKKDQSQIELINNNNNNRFKYDIRTDDGGKIQFNHNNNEKVQDNNKEIRYNNLFIKVEEGNQEVQQEKQYRNIASKVYQSSVSIRSTESLTPEIMQTIYFKHLSKTNPMFSLLLSPSTTLNLQQKNEILQALKLDHKQKYFQLIRQRQRNSKLFKEFEQFRTQSTKNLREIQQSNMHIYNDYKIYKQKSEWLLKRQQLSQIKYLQLLSQFQSLQNVSKLKDDRITIIQSNLKRLKDAYLQLNSKMIHIQRQERFQQIIKQKYDKKIMIRCLNQIKQRSRIWYIVNDRFRIKNIERDKQLKKIGFVAFINCRTLQRIIKWKIRQRNIARMRESFEFWKIQTQIDNKSKQLQKLRQLTICKQLFSHLKTNQANTKISKLKNIWALRFSSKKHQQNAFSKLKRLLQNSKQKNILSLNHYKYKTKKIYFKAFLNIIKENANKINVIYNNHCNTLLSIQFKKMIFVMRKDKADVQRKEYLVNKFYRDVKRKMFVGKIIQNNCFNKNIKTKVNILVKRILKDKNTNLLLQIMHNNLKRMNKYKKKCLKLSKLIRLNMIIRQNKSHSLQNQISLLKKRSFYDKMKQLYKISTILKAKQQKLSIYKMNNNLISKYCFIKRLQILKLSGKNYIKHRRIKQMEYQMNLNEQKTIQLVLAQQKQLSRYSNQIITLKNYIKTQSLRQMQLLQQKDDLLISMNENYEIMTALKRQIDIFKSEYNQQGDKYTSLIELYNQCKYKLERKEKEYQVLMGRIMNNIK